MKKYQILGIVFGVEVIIFFIMQELNVKIETWLGKIIAVVCFFLPIQLALYFLSKWHCNIW